MHLPQDIAARAIALREHGLTYARIGLELGISEGHAHRLARHAAAPVKPSICERPNEATNRERMRLGRHFLSFFPKRMAARDAGRIMGMSTQAVEFIEKMAGWKIAIRMREEMGHE